MFYNELEIGLLVRRVRSGDRPHLIRYADLLAGWVRSVNEHSDGWAYWSGGNRAGCVLAALLDRADRGEHVPEAAMNQAVGRIRAAATRARAKGAQIKVPVLAPAPQYVVRSRTEKDFDGETPLFWSNVLGWVDRASATVFSSTEYDLPIGGEWIRR